MKKFVDWGREKEWVVIEGNSLPTSLPFKDVLEKIEIGDEIYLEGGVPKQFLKLLLERDAKIFIIDSKGVKALRDSEKIAKSDFADAIMIKKFVDYENKCRAFTMRDFEFDKFKSIYYLYERTTKYIAALKNASQAFEKEYGERNQIVIESIKTNEQLKAKLLKQLTKAFKLEIDLFEDIKGLGGRYMVGLLLEAHPKNFSTLTKFLTFSGLKSKEHTNNKFKREVNSLFHQIAVNVVMHKDEKFYPFYLKIKEDLKIKNLDWKKGHVDNAAKNRIATFIAKEFYKRIRSIENAQKQF